MRNLFKVLCVLAIGLFSGFAMAQGGGGGLNSATTAATDLKTALFAFVAICAVIYLIWIGLMAFAEKKSWSDFGMAAIHVAIVGASVTLATWAWSLMQ